MKTFKKVAKKDGLKSQKRASLNAIPSISLTQEIFIPTFNNDIKGLGKSLQLIKAIKNVDSKKYVLEGKKKKFESRKSAKKIMKCYTGESQQLRTVTQPSNTLKKTKMSRSRSLPKSKSPANLKNLSSNNCFQKRLSFKLNHKGKDVSSSLLKLQKKLTKISMKEVLEDDSFALQSTLTNKSQIPFYNISSQNEDSFNIDQIRNYCTQQNHQRIDEILFECSKVNQTKLLVQRYSSLSPRLQNYRIKKEETNNLKQKQVQNIQQQIIVALQNSQNGSKQLEKPAQYKISKPMSCDYEVMIQRFKIEEINRWNDIIKIIYQHKNQAPNDIEKLLKILTIQSLENKKQLQILQHNHNKNTPRAKIESVKPIQQAIQNGKQNDKLQVRAANLSIDINQYDNSKYIQFLDSDIFPGFEKQPPKSFRNLKISKSKQDLLLQLLKKPKSSSQAQQSLIDHSQSLVNLLSKSLQNSYSNDKHKRSTSQIIQLKIKASVQLQDKNEGINIDKLIEDFLKNHENNQKEVSPSTSQEKLRLKISEFHHMKQQYQAFQILSPKRANEELEDFELKRSKPGFGLHPDNESFIMNIISQKQTLFENHQFEIQSQSQEDQDDKEARYETCSTIIVDKLILQILQDIKRSNLISNAYKSLIFQKKNKAKPKHTKGFQTSKESIQLFLNNLLKFIGKQHPDVFKHLEVPTGPTALEMLRFMHTQVDDQSSVQQDEAAVMVLPNKIFDGFWEVKQRSIVIDFPVGMDESSAIFRHNIQLLTSLNKIFIRCLFDTFNECLDHERNFGQFGRHFPWKRYPAFEHRKSQETIQNSVEAAKRRMMELSVIYCGLIVKKEDMSSLGEESLKQIHEDRLNRMLTSDFMQQQSRWIMYDDEETQILVQLSHIIGAELLIEGIQQLWLT